MTNLLEQLNVAAQIINAAATKLGIVDYLLRHPTFGAPQPSSNDEQFVVKSIQNFFSAYSTVKKALQQRV